MTPSHTVLDIYLLQASNQLAAEVAKISEFVDTSRDKRAWSEENVRSLQMQLKSAYKRMVENRKGYEIRCREEIQASGTREI